MGNSILAHCLYACNRVDTDLATFFSNTGNAHKIRRLNNTELDAQHLIEFPNPDVICVVEVVCNNWTEILRYKLSYEKWVKATPELHNAVQFFSYNIKTNSVKLWQEFYQLYKDPSWPQCLRFGDIASLPDEIQKEILLVYQEPIMALSSEDILAEWLTTCYYDCLTTPPQQVFPGSKILDLQNYLNGKIDILLEVCTQTLGWVWNQQRSDNFYQAMLTANHKYLVWLDNIKHATYCLSNNINIDYKFDTWEQALIIAKLCNQNSIAPENIKWDNTGCNNTSNNLYLENFKRTYHGKSSVRRLKIS
jgi:hypothetical protein